MTKKWFVVAVTGLLVLGIAVVAVAAPGGRFGIGAGSPAAGTQNWAPPFTQLDLTEEQYAKLRDIENKYFEKMQTLRNEISRKALELRNLYLQKNPDENAIEEKQKEISDLREQMWQLRQDKFNEANNVFTKEQLDKLNSLRGQGFGRGCGFGHKGFGRGMMGGNYNPATSQ
jgi:Spy/CpxP family protein refolding chaperone